MNETYALHDLNREVERILPDGFRFLARTIFRVTELFDLGLRKPETCEVSQGRFGVSWKTKQGKVTYQVEMSTGDEEIGIAYKGQESRYWPRELYLMLHSQADLIRASLED